MKFIAFKNFALYGIIISYIIILFLDGTVVCYINVFSLSQSLLPSLYTSNGSLLLVPISVIINRDMPFNHLLLSDAVSCIGVNSSTTINELSISFKKLCVWLGTNKYSLVSVYMFILFYLFFLM